MTNTELTAALDLLHDPRGANVAVAAPVFATDNFSDNGFVELSSGGLSYHFDDLEEVVVYVNSLNDYASLEARLDELEARLDAVEGED